MAENEQAEAPKAKAPTRYAVLKAVETEEGTAWLPVWQADAAGVDQMISLMQADGHEGPHAFVPLSRFHVKRLGYEQPPPEPTVEHVESESIFPTSTAPVPVAVEETVVEDLRPPEETEDDGA